MKIELVMFNMVFSVIISYMIYIRTPFHKNEYYDGFLVWFSIFAITFLLACGSSVIYYSLWKF